MQRFDDRRILITGAGSGIGQATVARLLDEGGKVVAYDVSEDGLAATAAAADDAGTGKRLTTVVLDVSSEDEVATAVDAAAAELGGLEVLVNAAAIQRCANTHEYTLDDWHRTLAVNLTGTFLMTRAALPALLDSERGVVWSTSPRQRRRSPTRTWPLMRPARVASWRSHTRWPWSTPSGDCAQ